MLNTKQLEEICEAVFLPESTNKKDFVKYNTEAYPDQYVLEVALPGVDRDKIDLQMTINKDMLSISTQPKKETMKEAPQKPEELKIGFDFTNTNVKFFLPEDIDTNGILSSYENGVLYITLPKGKEFKEKNIKIQ